MPLEIIAPADAPSVSSPAPDLSGAANTSGAAPALSEIALQSALSAIQVGERRGGEPTQDDAAKIAIMKKGLARESDLPKPAACAALRKAPRSQKQARGAQNPVLNVSHNTRMPPLSTRVTQILLLAV